MNINLQNGASPVMEQLNFFHDWVMIFVTSISVAILSYLILLPAMRPTHRGFIEAQNVEFAWTALPCAVLVAIALPSLRLLYMTDEAGEPVMTFKAVGHQWYWSYEFRDFLSADYDAYMRGGELRALECDNRVTVPAATPLRVLVTAADVLHSWTVPAMGVKADAVPGRLNQLTLYSDRPGVYYGQCREICGSNHSFIPIALESTPCPQYAIH